jgi:DNA polymerase III subunit gamma/tau
MQRKLIVSFLLERWYRNTSVKVVCRSADPYVWCPKVMESYIVSARKYRPATFEDVVGQSSITGTLQRAIANDHLAQALLFCGPRGVGKTTCARILAKAINHATGDFAEDEDFAFNIFELDAASNNSVDDIRNLIDQVRFAPQQGKFKVYIIDEVHMLSQAAFNAFLKTLEEPPAHAIFILATTEKHKIIPTILSRCQIFDFKRITVGDMVSHLANIAKREGVTIEDEALHVIAEKADGALRDALSIFDRIVTFAGNTVTYKDAVENLNILDHDYYFRTTDLVLQGDIPGSMLLFDEVLNSGFNGHEFINGVATHFRNLLMCQDAATVKLLEVTDRVAQRFLVQAKTCAPLNLLKSLRFMNECDVQYRGSKNQRLLVELTLMKMCALHKSPTGEAAEPVAEKKNLSRPVASAAPVVAVVAEPPSHTFAQPAPAQSLRSVAEKVQVVPPSSSSLQPQVQNGVASAVKLTGRRSARPGSVRISSIDEETEEQETDPDLLPKDAFSEERMLEVWNAAVERLFIQKPSLMSSLTKHLPTLSEPLVIELKLDSEHELEAINENRQTLLDEVRKSLNNFSVQLRTPVEEVITVKKAYTPKEKYEKMLDKNPHLDLLRDKFGLELDV